MPPKPDDFHVIGDVKVGNPGIYACLREKIPQGINPRILMLDLLLFQKAGQWIELLTWVSVRFDIVVDGNLYDQVQVLCGGEIIATIDVEIVT